MAFDFDFDLEYAVYELEQLDDLLCVFNEFVGDELPTKNEDGLPPEMDAQLFCNALGRYCSLTVIAQNLLRKIHQGMTEAIDTQLRSRREKKEADKKKGGDAA